MTKARSSVVAPQATRLARPASPLQEVPRSHPQVLYRNAISSRGRAERCYRTQEEADRDKIAFRPWNNTDHRQIECWKEDCFTAREGQ